MGFAVPASEIIKRLGDLLAGREVTRGWLGVSLLELDPLTASLYGISRHGGAIVNLSAAGSPAYKAGIRRGDIILTCDGAKIAAHEDLAYQTSIRRPGDVVEIVYLREGARNSVKVKLSTLNERSK